MATTPMEYMAHWFYKHKLDETNSREYSKKLASVCRDIDSRIFQRICSHNRDDYLDYFCYFVTFQDLCNDLQFNEPFFINSIAAVFNQKFPQPKTKLVKMWNLKPKLY